MLYYADILLIDANPAQVKYCATVLRSENYRVYVATSGNAAMQVLSQRKPQLILLDMQLKDTDGVTFCTRLKADERLKEIPVVFLTAETDERTLKLCFDCGGADYVKKPFSSRDLLVRVRTHLRLTMQQSELRAANRELLQFCSSVTHDLKSPFVSIQQLLGDLGKALREDYNGVLPSDIARILERVDVKAAKAELMITRLFDFSRMCNVLPVASVVHTDAITREIYEELMEQEANRGRIVHFTCEDLPDIVADETLFRMAMRNLLINALKYSSKKPEATVRVYAVPDASYYVIKVKDNGAGFDMEYAANIFKVFERLHTDSEFPGSGVGLALVNRIMERHSGRIEAYGEVDKGAEMTLYFPKNVKIKELEDKR